MLNSNLSRENLMSSYKECSSLLSFSEPTLDSKTKLCFLWSRLQPMNKKAVVLCKNLAFFALFSNSRIFSLKRWLSLWGDRVRSQAFYFPSHFHWLLTITDGEKTHITYLLSFIPALIWQVKERAINLYWCPPYELHACSTLKTQETAILY